MGGSMPFNLVCLFELKQLQEKVAYLEKQVAKLIEQRCNAKASPGFRWTSATYDDLY